MRGMYTVEKLAFLLLRPVARSLDFKCTVEFAFLPTLCKFFLRNQQNNDTCDISDGSSGVLCHLCLVLLTVACP